MRTYTLAIKWQNRGKESSLRPNAVGGRSLEKTRLRGNRASQTAPLVVCVRSSDAAVSCHLPKKRYKSMGARERGRRAKKRVRIGVTVPGSTVSGLEV